MSTEDFAAIIARINLARVKHETLVTMWNEDYDYRLANGLDREHTGEGLFG
jgi:hypothetical protein